MSGERKLRSDNLKKNESISLKGLKFNSFIASTPVKTLPPVKVNLKNIKPIKPKSNKKVSIMGENLKNAVIEDKNDESKRQSTEKKVKDLDSDSDNDEIASKPNEEMDIHTKFAMLQSKFDDFASKAIDINNGFKDILGDLQTRVNENQNNITVVDKKVLHLKKYVDENVITWENFSEYRNEADKVKDTIIITKAHDIQDAKEALETLIPGLFDNPDVKITPNYTKTKSKKTEGPEEVEDADVNESETDEAKSSNSESKNKEKEEDTDKEGETDKEKKKPKGKLNSVYVKMPNESFLKILREKKKLQDNARFRHVYVNKMVTKVEANRLYQLRQQKREIEATKDTAGKVIVDGTEFDLNKGKFKIINMDLRFVENVE